MLTGFTASGLSVRRSQHRAATLETSLQAVDYCTGPLGPTYRLLYASVSAQRAT